MSVEQKKLELLRYYPGLDALRAALMLIGILWHGSLFVSPDSGWIYKSVTHKSLSIFALIYPEHLFRMHAFFLVSGFLAQRVLISRDKNTFLKMRIKRILVPLLLGCVIVNFIGFAFRVHYLHQFEWSSLRTSQLVAHGWFLVVLFWFAIIDVITPRKIFSTISSSVTKSLVISIALIIISGFLKHGLGYMNTHYWHIHALWLLWFNLLVLFALKYYPYYFIGKLLFYHQQRIESVTKNQLWLVGIVAYVSMMLTFLRDIYVADIFNYFPFSMYLYNLTKIVAAFSITFLLFSISYKQTKESTPLVNYLVKSSIVVYLVHILMGIIFAVFLDKFPMNTPVYFLLLIILTTIASFLFYEIIRRFKWLRFAFGLKDNAAPKLG